LQICVLGSQGGGGGGSFVVQVKSDNTSLPGRFVDALNRVPDATQLKC
jgi:hypothetical protein